MTDESAVRPAGGETAAAVAPDAAAERALLAGLRANHEEAFAQLVREYGPRMLAVVRRLLKQEADAHDALQDAFLSAFRSLHAFEGASRLGTWLHRIAINAALMKLRRKQRTAEVAIDALLPKFQDDGHHAQPVSDWGRPAHELLGRQEDREYVRACIARLPDSHRTVLMLRDIEGLDTQETAQMLGIEANTVKVRLHRARQALRTLLEERFGGPRE